MHRFGEQCPVSHPVASQLIRHYRARFIVMALKQTPEEAFGGFAISARL
jgi:hypothetical protein